MCCLRDQWTRTWCQHQEILPQPQWQLFTRATPYSLCLPSPCKFNETSYIYAIRLLPRMCIRGSSWLLEKIHICKIFWEITHREPFLFKCYTSCSGQQNFEDKSGKGTRLSVLKARLNQFWRLISNFRPVWHPQALLGLLLPLRQGFLLSWISWVM